MASDQRPIGQLAFYGVVTVLCYALLYAYEEPILAWTTRGRWYFVLPVAIAFVFSVVHGVFTGLFWEVLGIRARNTNATSTRGGRAR